MRSPTLRFRAERVKRVPHAIELLARQRQSDLVMAEGLRGPLSLH
jgi:hypothetical protein